MFESASVVVTLFGAPSWRSSGHGPSALSRKDAALFALLAIDGEWPRDRIAAWLWPEVPIRSANLNLRQRLFKLRKTSGHRLIEAAATLRLLPDVVVDVRSGPSARPGELLAGHDLGDLPELDEWLQAARATLARQHADHLAGQASQLEANGALAEAIALCERIVGATPWHEHSWRRLMRLHYLRGDRAAAIHAFERFERLVREEQGSRPSAETIDLLATIERGNAPAGVGHTPLPASLIRPPVLVGRQPALALMRQAWTDGRAILLIGAGGIGKTRVMTDFVQGQGQSERVTLRARPGDAGMPYAVVAGVLQAIIERYRLSLTAPLRLELSRVLPQLGDAPRSEGQQARLWAAVESALAQALSQGLTAVIIDDLHFADAASVELLRWLLASATLTRLRWCFASRPDEPEPATPLLQAWLGDSNRLQPVPLAPLAASEVQALVDSLEVRSLQGMGATMAQALYRHAGGHPFYTLETLKAMVLSGAADGLRDMPLPAAAQAMVERRLARLSTGARDLLRLAAVADADLSLDMAAAILQRPLIDLAQTWAELEAAQVMQGHGFAHDLVRECALATVPQAARAPLHRALAHELQRHSQADPARLARHSSAAGDWPQAAAQWRRAAGIARVAGRMAEHEQFLVSAAEAFDQAGDAAGRFDALCQAVAATLLVQGSQAALDRLATLAPLAGTDGQRARLQVLQVEALLNLARFADALAAATEAVRIAEPGSSVQADAISLYGRSLALNGRAAEATDLLQQAAESARALGDEGRELIAVAALAHAHFASGRPGPAVTQQQRAVELAQRSGDLAEMANAAANLATLAYFAGDAGIGHHSASDAEQRFVALRAEGNRRLYNRIILARCSAHLGRLDAAWDALQAASRQTAADAGATSPALAGIALAGLKQWLGLSLDIRSSLGALVDDASALPPLARAGLYLAQARFARLSGADDSAALGALQALGLAHPGLRDDPALCLDWSRFGDPQLAVAQLQKVRATCASSGADGLDRSLALRQVDRLMDFDAAAAARLALELQATLAPSRRQPGQPHREPPGLHPATYPPEAWWTLARALRGSSAQAAQACRVHALRWIDAAVLPDPSEAARLRFQQGNPLNRVVLAGW